MHAAKHTLRCGVALRCSELKQPPHLCKVCRLTVEVHAAEQRRGAVHRRGCLRVGIILLLFEQMMSMPSCSKLIMLYSKANQPPLFARKHVS